MSKSGPVWSASGCGPSFGFRQYKTDWQVFKQAFHPLSQSPISFCCCSCSYPIGQRTQGVDGENEAKEGNWPAVPGGGVIDTITESAQTLTKSQPRYPKPNHDI